MIHPLGIIVEKGAISQQGFAPMSEVAHLPVKQRMFLMDVQTDLPVNITREPVAIPEEIIVITKQKTFGAYIITDTPAIKPEVYAGKVATLVVIAR